MRSLYRLFVATIVTFFYVGYLPFIPGTFGSLAGVGLIFVIKNNGSAHILFTLVLIVLGFLLTGYAEKMMNKKDARCIVIDEVCGMFVSLLFIPYDIKLVIIGFFLFRIFDSLKPFPISRLEKLHGSLGVMGDDIMAGLYTNLVLQAVFRCVSIKAS